MLDSGRGKLLRGWRFHLILCPDDSLIWNCSAAMMSLSASYSRSLIRRHRPHVVVLLEKRVVGLSAEKVCRQVGRE